MLKAFLNLECLTSHCRLNCTCLEMYQPRHTEAEFTDRKEGSAPWEGSPPVLTAAAWSAAGASTSWDVTQRETQMPNPQQCSSKICWLRERC